MFKWEILQNGVLQGEDSQRHSWESTRDREPKLINEATLECRVILFIFAPYCNSPVTRCSGAWRWDFWNSGSKSTTISDSYLSWKYSILVVQSYWLVLFALHFLQKKISFMIGVKTSDNWLNTKTNYGWRHLSNDLNCFPEYGQTSCSVYL